MTVSTQVSRNEYTGNGATTQYDFTFRILDKSHLLVQTLDTSESIVTLTLGTDYTVTGVNRYNGGKVVLTSALPAGYKISIERSTPVTQEASIRNQGGFFPEIHEDALDKLTMLVQQAYGWWSGLSLRKPSWLANYYDALNNRIRNLRDPSQAQDAATKHYVDEQIVDNTNAWKEGDRVLEQKIDANFRRTIRVPESDVEMVPPVAERKDSLFGWNNSGRPVPIFAMTETADLALKLASNIGTSFIGYKNRTVYARLSDKVVLTDYPGAAEGKNNDSTAAFDAAYATGLPVYVPHGEWFTSDYQREKLYGPGVVYSNDQYFTDPGERPVSGSIETGRAIVEHTETWGNRERAAGRSIIVNNPAGRVQVSGFSSPAQYATYTNSDHVGYYIGMYGPKNQTLTTAASTQYTSSTLTAPELISTNDIRVGMFVKTKHSPSYKAKIMAIDFESNTATVDGWYAIGNTSAGQVPANGYSALINAADKIWGQNTVVFFEQDSSAVTATGYELGFQLDTAPGNPVWGFHSANYHAEYYTNHAFRATGLWLTGVYLSESVRDGMQKNVSSKNPTGAAVFVSDLIDNGWTGSAVHLDTNYRKSTSFLAQIKTGGITQFYIDSRGYRSSIRESAVVVGSSATLTPLTPSIILCNNTAAILLNALGSFSAGHIFKIKAGAKDVVFADVTMNSANGIYAEFVFDGTQWLKMFQSN